MFASNSSQVSSDAVFIEDIFSTYLYTGDGSTQTITNNIDLSTKGGLVWLKKRDGTADNHYLFDTARGTGQGLNTNTTDASGDSGVTAFGTTGFSVNTNGNNASRLYASWTFRKQPKFFDIVTWSGNGVANRQISHNLGSTPGCIIVKATNNANAWTIWHRSVNSGSAYLEFSTAAADTSTAAVANRFGNGTSYVAPTSTNFTVGANGATNGSGITYVAYLFAHDAGGFGAAGTDNVISCGSYTGNGSENTITLGYEPQFVLLKKSSAVGDWHIYDNMRGMSVLPFTSGTGDMVLKPNTSGAETDVNQVNPSPTGFIESGYSGSGQTIIYIAIRRGPMKTPTSGTTVFSPNASSAATGTQITTNFPVDMQIWNIRTGDGNNSSVSSRLQGVSSTTTESARRIITSSTDIEITTGNVGRYWNNTGFQMPSYIELGSNIFWNFRRAPGFMDEVCYTGTGVARNVTHNLGVAPELIIIKRRDTITNWMVYQSSVTNTNDKHLRLNLTDAVTQISGFEYWGTPSTATPNMTATTFGLGTRTEGNASGSTYVAYLFASCPGVSKVGTYTGTGTTLQINCGFTGGARFVMIKRTDNSGGWYVWDTARGIIGGNDPFSFLNTTAAETTNTDYIDAYSAGFEISSTAPAAINASGGTFIYMAIS